jgi:hypothetical protein
MMKPELICIDITFGSEILTGQPTKVLILILFGMEHHLASPLLIELPRYPRQPAHGLGNLLLNLTLFGVYKQLGSLPQPMKQPGSKPVLLQG